MKTPEELNALKEEVETLSKKLAELDEEELKQVSGGGIVVEDWFVREYDISLSASENGEGKKPGNPVGIFPGLPAFP